MMAFKCWMRQSKASGELARERTVQRTSGHVTRQPDVCRQYTGGVTKSADLWQKTNERDRKSVEC